VMWACGRDLDEVAMKAEVYDEAGDDEVGLERSDEVNRGVGELCRGRRRR